MDRGAIISDCGRFRYRLWRYWDVDLPRAVFIMLNPSTADADVDDPTIRKCSGFATRLGYGGIDVVNLYAFRATKPADLKAANYPVGPDNDQHTREACASGDGSAICAWGVNARNSARARYVLDMLRYSDIRRMVLKRAADGTPCHPLMLPYTCKLHEIV